MARFGYHWGGHQTWSFVCEPPPPPPKPLGLRVMECNLLLTMENP